MKVRKILCLLLTSVLLISTFTACGNSDSTPSANPSQESSQEQSSTPAESEPSAPTESDQAQPSEPAKDEIPESSEPAKDETPESSAPTPDPDALTGKTSSEIVANMGFGFNIGNSLDATSGRVSDVLKHEQAWGNPVITQELVDGVVAAGFTTIRIPTTWYSFVSTDGKYTIDPAYLARVKEVVDYCYKHDVYIILNLHHEEWINTSKLVTNQDEIAKEIGALWAQIADYFADYDQHLIFEGMNEPRLAGTNIEWSGNQEAYNTVNYFNQVFANAVRSSGKGYNHERCLMIPGYAASNSASVLRTIYLPTYNGETVNNLIISTHSYSPYSFCLSAEQQNFDLSNPSDTSSIDTVFETIKTEFLDHGIPVVIGETSATGKTNNQARVNWVTYMATKAAEHGVPIVLWDNGAPGTGGSENHCYFNRRTGELADPDFVNAMMKVKSSITWGSAVGNSDTNDAPSDSIVGGDIIFSYPDGHTSQKEWDSTYITTPAQDSYFYEGQSVAVVYEGKGSVKMVLNSASLSQWWMPIDPDKEETVNGKKIAYFSTENIAKVIKGYGVTQFSQLTDMSFLSCNGSVTTYEVSTVGSSATVLYKVNGATYHTGTTLPADPVLKHLSFLGWYTTKDYQPGTEYKGEKVDENTIVYAKFGLEK